MIRFNNLFQKQNHKQPETSNNVVKKKILIVEDEPSLSEIYNEILTTSGFEVYIAANGQEGLDQIVKNSPNLIFLDIMMPIMDGKTMLSHLKNDSEYTAYKNIPVVMLTNAGTSDNMNYTKILGGASEFIIKSNITPNEIVNIANRHIH